MTCRNIVTDACNQLMSDDAFWLLASLTDRAYEEVSRNSPFWRLCDRYRNVGITPATLKRVQDGINENLLSAIQANLPYAGTVTHNPKFPDIEIPSPSGLVAAKVEVKYLFEISLRNRDGLRNQYVHVAQNVKKLNDERRKIDPTIELFLILFFMQLPNYSYPRGKWPGEWPYENSGQIDAWPARKDMRDFVAGGIPKQFDLVLDECKLGQPDWPETKAPALHQLRFYELRDQNINAESLNAWFDLVFPRKTRDDKLWKFVPEVHLKDAQVGCAIWAY